MPTTDELYAEVRRTFDEPTRRELLIQATNLVNEGLPVAVLDFDEALVGYSDRLQNYELTAWGVDLSYVWIQR